MVDLTPDCSQCAALCCLALAFDSSELFGFDKAAGEACRHLGDGGQCAIHADLAKKGFGGCVQYQCDGAGQRVVQEVFAGQSWQDNPKLKAPMMEAFRAMRLVHEQLVLLKAAENLRLSQPQQAEAQRLKAALTPAEGWAEESLYAVEPSGMLKQCDAFFRGLQDVAKNETNGP